MDDELVEKARDAGFFYVPLSISEFIDRLGLSKVLYPAWHEHLKVIFPDPISVAHNYVLLTGAIGTGKSTVSKIAALYTAYRLLCLKDLSKFALFITKPIQFLFFHVKIEKAREEFIEYITDIFGNHDLFNEIRELRRELGLKDIPISFKADGAKSNSSIGGDVIFYVFSEANFVSETVIKYKLDQAYNRFKSRFIAALPYIGNIIIDTSSSFEGSIIDHLGHRKDDFYIVRMSQWQAKAHTGIFFRKGSFLVYTGGAAGEPKILGDKEQLTEQELEIYEKDKIIEVPREYEKEFRSDIYEALISLAGVSIKPPDTLFAKEMVMNIMSLPNPIPEIVSVIDLPSLYEDIIKVLPLDKGLVLHIDTSIRGDNTGIAIAYWYDDYTVAVPIAFALHNNGDDIPMYLIEDFISYIANHRSVLSVSADSYQSYKLLQDITIRNRIETKTISIDQNATIYFNLKKAVIDKTIKIAYSNLLADELSNLRYFVVGFYRKARIDHPPSASKDVADAVACAHYNLREITSKRKAFVSSIEESINTYRNRLYNTIRVWTSNKML